MFNALFASPFLQMALWVGLAASVASGVMGSFVVARRIVFISGSIAHSVLGGMGLFLWIQRTWGISWLSPMHGALLSAITSALLIGWSHLQHRQRDDATIAALWSMGMSIGVIFIALTPGYNVELIHYLFGNILWATRADLLTLLGLDCCVLAIVALFRDQFLTICFDEQQAQLQHVHVKAFYLLLLCLIALSVVLLIQVVGAILVIAMLAIPAAIATNFTHRFNRIMLFSVFIGWGFTFFGIVASYQFNWPPGATIALLAALCYLLSVTWKRKMRNEML